MPRSRKRRLPPEGIDHDGPAPISTLRQAGNHDIHRVHLNASKHGRIKSPDLIAFDRRRIQEELHRAWIGESIITHALGTTRPASIAGNRGHDFAVGAIPAKPLDGEPRDALYELGD
jgi:hypothetical protein